MTERCQKNACERALCLASSILRHNLDDSLVVRQQFKTMMNNNCDDDTYLAQSLSTYHYTCMLQYKELE